MVTVATSFRYLMDIFKYFKGLFGMQKEIKSVPENALD